MHAGHIRGRQEILHELSSSKYFRGFFRAPLLPYEKNSGIVIRKTKEIWPSGFWQLRKLFPLEESERFVFSSLPSMSKYHFSQLKLYYTGHFLFSTRNCQKEYKLIFSTSGLHTNSFGSKSIVFKILSFDLM